MLNLIITLSVTTLLLSLYSFKVKKLSKVAFGCTVFVLMLCCIYYGFLRSEYKSFSYLLNEPSVSWNIKTFSEKKYDSSLKKLIVFSIADNIENLSDKELEEIFIDNNDSEFVGLIFKRIKDKGFVLSDKVISIFVAWVADGKNFVAKDYFVPSVTIHKAVYKYISDKFENNQKTPKDIGQIKNLIDGFPDIFSKKDKDLIGILYKTVNDKPIINDNSSKTAEELENTTKKLQDYESQLFSLQINWSLEGKIKEEENGLYLVEDVTVNNKNESRCIVKFTETKPELNTSVSISVKEDGEEHIKLKDEGFVTLKCYKEDYSDKKRIELTEKINECKQLIENLNSDADQTLDSANINSKLIEININTLRRNINQKVAKYEL